jgi:small-conductance mechanosensitive channel
MFQAFWWICVFGIPIWITRSGLFPGGIFKLLCICITYAALISLVAWLVWGYLMFGNALATWVITTIEIVATSFLARKLANSERHNP